MPFTFKSRVPEAQAKVDAAVLEAVTSVFELDIVKAAKQDSPVLTGTNRRSIDCEVHETPKGPAASLFTQSGYGGYLETGTRKMKAQPYLYPAFQRFVGKIQTEIKRILING